MKSPTGLGKLLFHLYHLAWTGLDWVYPPYCGGCGKQSSRWCSECRAKTIALDGNICICCGEPQKIRKLCEKCRNSLPALKSLRSWAIYNGPLRYALLRLKYKGDIALGEILSQHLIMILNNLDWKIDIISPVPTSIVRSAQRGYNQAALLAYPLALGSGIRYSPRAIKKVQEIQSQVGLSETQRHRNVERAFVSEKDLVKGKSILIVDDIVTTGATLNACAIALLKSGAREVYGLTLARTGNLDLLNQN